MGRETGGTFEGGTARHASFNSGTTKLRRGKEQRSCRDDGCMPSLWYYDASRLAVASSSMCRANADGVLVSGVHLVKLSLNQVIVNDLGKTEKNKYKQ